MAESQLGLGMAAGNGHAGETKHDKFRRLAPKRIQAVLDALDRLGSLGPPNYACTPEDAARVIAALRGRLDLVESRLIGRRRNSFSWD